MPDRKKIGLVLAGGGAKGAYAFGCMKAMKKMGIKVDVVAGTSVGALNAFLWSTGAMKEGEQLWKNLSFSSIYPVAILDPMRHSRPVILAFSALFVLVNLFWAGIRLRPIPAATLLFAIISLGLTGAFVLLFRPSGSVLFAPVAGLATFWALKSRAPAKLGAALSIWFMLLPIGNLYDGLVSGWLKPLIELITVLFLLAALIAVCFAVKIAVERLFPPHRTILENSALHERLKEMIERHCVDVPCYVTTAFQEESFDPDAPTYEVQSFGVPLPSARCKLERVRRWFPSYHTIGDMKERERLNALMASAALPFGIVPPIRIGNKTHHVDGGVIDNVPALPLVTFEKCDHLYVVLLRPFCSDKAAIKRGVKVAMWRKLQRLLDLLQYSPPVHTWAANKTPYPGSKPPKIVPYRDLPVPSMTVLYPSKRLGGFLSGTLRFEGVYAEELMVQGEQDTLAKLQ